MYKYIEVLIMEKDFIQATHILLSNYGKISAKDRAEYDSAILALSYFKSYQSNFPKKAKDIYDIWKDFDRFLIEKGIFSPIAIVPFIAQSLMKDIFEEYNHSRLKTKDFSNIQDTIMLATSMVWLGEIKGASFLLLGLLKTAPMEAEVWALCGRIYDILGDEKKSVLFYREAFFINPSVLNLIDIRFRFIEHIIEYFLLNLKKISFLNHKEAILEWLGISGIIGKFFHIRQTLSYEDEALLNRRIGVYEGYYLKSHHKKHEDFVKLLRLYLFKYDYFKAKNQSEMAEETKEKIELLSPLIYNKLD